MMHHYKYSLTEIENMYPFERDIYVDMIIAYNEEQKKKSNG